MEKKILPKVTAVIPCFNEEENIEKVLKTLIDHSKISEIICVNDGSTDNSSKILRKYKKLIKLIELPKNQGKGRAVSQGIKKANNPLILLLDADLSNLSPQHITNLLKPIQEGFRGSIGYPDDNLVNKFMTKVGGQRVYYKSDLIPLIQEINSSDYGMEIILNRKIKGNIKYVNLQSLGHINTFKKRTKIKEILNYSGSWILSVSKALIKTNVIYNFLEKLC